MPHYSLWFSSETVLISKIEKAIKPYQCYCPKLLVSIYPKFRVVVFNRKQIYRVIVALQNIGAQTTNPLLKMKKLTPEFLANFKNAMLIQGNDAHRTAFDLEVSHEYMKSILDGTRKAVSPVVHLRMHQTIILAHKEAIQSDRAEQRKAANRITKPIIKYSRLPVIGAEKGSAY